MSDYSLKKKNIQLAKLELRVFCKCQNIKKSSWISQQYAHKYILPLLPKIEGNYDLAINFLGVSDVINDKVNANVKVGWVHTDYDQLTVNKQMDRNIYSKLDFIVNVSEDCNRVFLKHYPELFPKAIVVENILSKKMIVMQSNAFCPNSEMPKKKGFTTNK